MEGLGYLPPEWENKAAVVSDVKQANGFVKDYSYGADSQLYVRFDRMPEAVWKEEDGETVVKEFVYHDYVWIQRPGDRTQVYHQRAKKRHIRRFPKHYEAFKSGKEQGMLGIPLSSWDYQLSQADLHALRLLGVEYVHQLASISDSTLPALGLEAKIWRAAARVTLDEMAEKQHKVDMQLMLSDRDEHIKALQEEANGTKSELEAMKDQMAQLTRLLSEKAKADPLEKEVARIEAKKKKSGGGRKCVTEELTNE